jgi:GT2 family glycosyltransferase
MKYCFAIVTFKRCELLGKLLDSIYCQKGVFDYSVVVWDNDPLGSAYDTVAKYKHAVYIRSDKNLGGSGGFYSVFSESVKYDWDYLISADDDIEFTCDFLQIIEASIRRYQNSVILPQRIYSVDGSDYTWGPKLKKNSVSRISYHLKNTNEDSEVDLITFEGCVYPRNVILSVGFPDPLFYIDGDDWEYGVRIRKQNYSIIRTANKLIKRNIKPHQDISVCNICRD